MKYNLLCKITIFYRKGESSRDRDRVNLFYDITKKIYSEKQIFAGDFIQISGIKFNSLIEKIIHTDDLKRTNVHLGEIDMEIDPGKEHEILAQLERNDWAIKEVK